jgi:hypothetical protein
MRRLNDYGSGYGVLAILIPFGISTILVAVSYAALGTPINETYKGVGIVDVPVNYYNMSEQDRADYLADLHGGQPTKVWGTNWGGWTLPIFTAYKYPDGTIIQEADYKDFIKNKTNVDYTAVVLNVLSVNPPLLDDLKAYGYLIRVVMILSICLGLLELIWIG